MTKKTQPKSGSEIFVPLNMLKKSPRNVRKVGRRNGHRSAGSQHRRQRPVAEPRRGAGA